MSIEFSPWTPDTPKKFVTRETTEYSCVYCGRGSDRKTEIFSEGGCKHCGAPAKEYIKTQTFETIQDTGRKVILFDSFAEKDDTDKLIEKIRSEHNIEVVRFSSMIQSDMSVTEKVEIAKKAANVFGLVFIVASKDVNLAMGRIPTIALSEAISSQPEGVIKPIVLLSNKADFKYMPEGGKKIAALSLNDEGFAEEDFGDVDDHEFVLPHRNMDKVIKLFKKSRGG